MASDRAFKARSLFCSIKSTDKSDPFSRAARPRTVDGVTFTNQWRAYRGTPTEAMLKDSMLAVCTVLKKPWPGSALDMATARAPENAKERADGKPRVGPGYMADLERRGLWPDERTLEAERFVLAKLEDPRKVARALLTREGLRGEKLETAVERAAIAVEGGGRVRGRMPDVDLLTADADEKLAAEAKEEATAKTTRRGRKASA